ncbi:MAG: hypothetical protein IJ218_03790 [Alphaproteobacteria bacterium]|nr:hypothetical protein [Alphaproteobacteria bacterium]
MTIFGLILILCIIIALPAYANPACAVCTAAVAVGLEIARKLGVDDGVIAIWAGALLTLIGYWTILWFDKKGWNFKGRNLLLMLLSFSVLGAVYIKDLVYTPRPILIFYLDPFLFCGIIGALLLIYSSVFYQWMKRRNGGHAHFPFEKVVLPVMALIIAGYIVDYLQICTSNENTLQTISVPSDGSDIYDFNQPQQ